MEAQNVIGVKDCEMPDSCCECRFATNGVYCAAKPPEFCGYTNDFEKDGRTKWCPLIKLSYPDFSNSYIDPDSYVRIGDIMDCLSEVLCPDNELIHIEGLFEWAMGKRAMSKDELFEYLYRDFEEREVLDE